MDAEKVLKLMAALETKRFIAATPSLINISPGQYVDTTVKDNLISMNELGLMALSESLSSDQKKTSIVKLNTFQTQNKKPKKSRG